jgi:DNA-binding NtrC family response regulator
MESKELNLLVVEDDPQMARMLKRILDKYWKNVTVAESAGHGIAFLAGGVYDVVLTDWDCPNPGDGLRVINSTTLPVVIHTGNKVVCGVVCVLQKPADITVINDALMSAWRNKHPQ